MVPEPPEEPVLPLVPEVSEEEGACAPAPESVLPEVCRGGGGLGVGLLRPPAGATALPDEPLLNPCCDGGGGNGLLGLPPEFPELPELPDPLPDPPLEEPPLEPPEPPLPPAACRSMNTWLIDLKSMPASMHLNEDRSQCCAHLL